MPTVIVGASPKARLVLDFLASEGRLEEIHAIVDEDPAKKGQHLLGKPVVGDLGSFLATRYGPGEHGFCICLSEKRYEDRRALRTLLQANGCIMAPVVSRHAHIAASATVGPGSIIFPGTFLNCGAVVGQLVTLYTGCLVEHDTTIEDNVDISPRAALAGRVVVASESFIGLNATILPGLKIGPRAVVGGGAVVTKDVQPGTTVVGNPARVLESILAGRGDA